jgi:hypothetical protein
MLFFLPGDAWDVVQKQRSVQTREDVIETRLNFISRGFIISVI